MQKSILITLAITFITLTAFAQNSDTLNNDKQDLRFEVNGKYSRPIRKEKLNEAKFLNDFIAYYPTNWITEYISVEIFAFCNGKAMKEVSANNALSAQQQNILNTIDLGTDLIINVKYRYNNPAIDIIENKSMNVSMTVVPEVEAEYVGGQQQMIKYLKESAIDKISDAYLLGRQTIPNQFQQSLVLFTVNEEGEITNAKISMSTGDSKADALLLEAINNMPKWKPAENWKGIKVKQEFVFSVGNGGC